jgi:hypothetical protein
MTFPAGFFFFLRSVCRYIIAATASKPQPLKQPKVKDEQIMEFLKLDYIRQHSRLCSNEEDALLTEYANSAEWIIANWLNRGGTPQSTVASLMEEYGCVPEPILEAGQLLVDNSYLHRSPTETTNLSAVPYGTIDFKLEPFRIAV